ncbi:toxin-antitoxin system HicB family antitoxin [Microbacterium trichothecenolyticum]|uniref:toxin-antitoxin system HicB family antitoxin n=1 Tax=Microbacterium trichothecenolyticum TaxID=69370 RepID=UPI0035BE7784
MQIATHVEELQRRLAAAAAPESAEVAARLAAALEPAARLAILEALSEAAGEITRELAPGSVDLRLRGREIDFVVARPQPERATEATANPSGPVVLGGAASDDPDDATARTTLRLPDSLKARAEAAAAAEGLSLNTWLVRAVATAVEPAPPAARSASSAYTGWVR